MTWKPVCLVFATLILFSPTIASGNVMCEDADGNYTVALTTADDGGVLDLAIVNGDRIARFPDANRTKVSVKNETYKFSAGKKKGQDALALDIAGKAGKMTYGGKTVVLECTW